MSARTTGRIVRASLSASDVGAVRPQRPPDQPSGLALRGMDGMSFARLGRGHVRVGRTAASALVASLLAGMIGCDLVTASEPPCGQLRVLVVPARLAVNDSSVLDLVHVRRDGTAADCLNQGAWRWTSSAPAVFSVDSDARRGRAVAVGRAVVTGTDGRQEDQVEVEVTGP